MGVNRFVEDTSQSQLSEKVHMKDLEFSQVTNYLTTISQDQFESLDDGAEYDQNFDDLLHFLTKAISGYYVSHSLHKMSDTSDFNEKDLYFTTFISLARGLTPKQLDSVHENHLSHGV